MEMFESGFWLGGLFVVCFAMVFLTLAYVWEERKLFTGGRKWDKLDWIFFMTVVSFGCVVFVFVVMLNAAGMVGVCE